MKHPLFHVPALAIVFFALVLAAVARQAAPLMPPLPAGPDGRLQITRGIFVSADYAVAVAAAAQATNADPALLFALIARSRFAAETYGVSVAFDPDAPVGGPYAYGSAHWLRDLSLYGKDAGYSELAMAVVRLPSGELAIPDPDIRFRAMTLRTDPYLATFLAAKAWQKARQDIGALRAPSDGLVMIAFRAGVEFANALAERSDRDRNMPLEVAARADRDVLLVMSGLPAVDARTGKGWAVGAFIDEITSRMRNDISAYSATRRIDVPDDYRPRVPTS
jgi:hypothetical protein